MRKILVADDSLTIQKVIRLALSQEGYEIETLGDGNSLLQRLPVFRPDVVLVDISLPGRSAFDARREVLKNPDLASIRWVLMSSAFDQVNDQQVSELKFHGRLIKPFDPTYLRKVLLEAGASLNPPGVSPPAKPRNANVIPPAPPAPPSPPSFAPPAPMLAPTFPSGPSLQSNSPTGLIEIEDSTLGKDLWSETMGLGISPFAPATEAMTAKEVKPVAAPETPTVDDDVIKLTQSTVRMSGLEHYQWNVHEPATQGQNPFADAPTNSAAPLPLEPPPKPQSFEPFEPIAPQPTAASPPAREPALGTEQIQQLVNREIAEQIQRIARDVLPDIAERIIKEEIHKMLANPPGSS